jgi:hypothetical protein
MRQRVREAPPRRCLPRERLHARRPAARARYIARRVLDALRFRVLLLQVAPVGKGMRGVEGVGGVHGVVGAGNVA